MSSDPAERTPRLDDFHVGDWLVEPALCRLSRGETRVRLRPQLMDLLVCLAGHPGRVVLKDDIFKAVWPDQHVAESGLARCVAELRQALNDAAQEPTYIETIPKRGYRLIAPVAAAAPDEQAGDGAAAGPANGRLTPGSPANDGGVNDVEGRAILTTAGSGSRGRTARRPGGAWWLVGVAGAVLAVAGVATLTFRPAGPSPLGPQDKLVLCFENHTDDPVFDGTLALALAVQMEQSPFLRVVSTEHVAETLRYMGRDPDGPFTRTLAAEVCVRDGARAMLVGGIDRLGDRYVLGLEAVACGTGEMLAREQVQAADKDEVLAALGAMASTMRRRLGESLASLASYDVPVVQATTASLEALRAASLGDVECRTGRIESGVQHYRRAIDLDPTFALAYSRLGAALGVAGYAQEQAEAITRAYELRERTSVPERLEIEARYQQGVRADFGATIAALESLRHTHPGSSLAHRGLAQTYALVGRYDEELAEAQEAARLEPDGSQEYAELARAYQHRNRFEEARAVAETAVARQRAGPVSHAILFDCAFALGDARAMERERGWAAADPGARLLFLQFEAEAAIYGGRLKRARALLQTAETMVEQRGDAERLAELRLTEALYEALYGRAEQVRGLVDGVLAHDSSGAALLQAAIPLALAGERDRAAHLVATLDGAPGRLAGEFWSGVRAIVIAAVEADRGRYDRAFELLKPLAPYELGVAYEFLPLIVRGRICLAAGRAEEAETAFRRVLSHNGIDPSSEMLPMARLGLARARTLAGDAAGARTEYDALLALWRDGDADLPILERVRRERALLK